MYLIVYLSFFYYNLIITGSLAQNYDSVQYDTLSQAGHVWGTCMSPGPYQHVG